MDQNFNAEERELVKLVGFFKKRAEKLIAENKLDAEYAQLIETCDKLVEQLNMHVKNRGIILGEREQLKNLVKDNAQCPKCFSNANLKMVGTDVSPQGWKSNKYKCRRCNIEFVWNAPNNPWDMVSFVEHFMAELEKRSQDENLDEEAKKINMEALTHVKANLGKLKPVVEAAALDLADLEVREKEMAEMVNKVKKHLLIEKIRLDL